MVEVLLGFFAYMAFILVVGLVAGRRTKGRMESFYLGDRKVGAWVTAISASASSESGWLVLGCVAMGYVYGAVAYWITIGCVLGFTFNWFFFAERIRKASAANGAITVPEFLESATGARTKAIRTIGVLIIFVLMFTYVAAQLTAAGVALESVFAWPYWVGVLIGAAITILYTTVGGYRAVSWTDLFQGLLMVVALVVLPIMAYLHLGGWENVKSRILERPAQEFHVFKGFVGNEYKVLRVERDRPARLESDDGRTLEVRVETIPDEASGESGEVLRQAIDGGPPTEVPEEDGKPVIDPGLIGLDGRLVREKKYDPVGGSAFFSLAGGMVGLVFLGWIVEMLGIGLGYPGSPHVVTRFMAARSSKEIARGRVIALTWAVLAEGGAVTMGILARALFPDIADPQAGLLETAGLFLPPLLVGLMLAAVFAALRSTADSQLLVASSAIVRDLGQSVLGWRPSEKQAMLLSRVVVLVLGTLAVLLALSGSRFIFWFVLFSWAGLGASFAPSLILAVWWRRLSPAGVVASMVTGFVTTIVWSLWVREPLREATGLDVYELVPAFALSFAAALLFSLLVPRRDAREDPAVIDPTPP